MTLRTGEDSFEGGSSRSHYVEASFWRRLWTCRQTDYWMMMYKWSIGTFVKDLQKVYS